MPHKIEISDKTYERLKEFCALNGLKIGQQADKLIYDGLMIEMYGDVPFTDYRKPKKEMKEIPFPQKIAEEFPPEKFQELYQANPEPPTKEKVEEMKKEMEKVEAEHPQTYMASEEMENEIQREMLKQVGVPTKVVNKITKRRLK